MLATSVPCEHIFYKAKKKPTQPKKSRTTNTLVIDECGVAGTVVSTAAFQAVEPDLIPSKCITFAKYLIFTYNKYETLFLNFHLLIFIFNRHNKLHCLLYGVSLKYVLIICTDSLA